jgi:hypothetical protein
MDASSEHNDLHRAIRRVSKSGGMGDTTALSRKGKRQACAQQRNFPFTRGIIPDRHRWENDIVEPHVAIDWRSMIVDR